MDFVKQSGKGHSGWRHGLVFSLGVLISFWVLVGVLIGLRSAGQAVGWGFQLQEPVFVFSLLVFLFIFSLSFFGVFEFGLGLTCVGGELTCRKGYSGSFFSGILATILATPCSAPLMAPAIGYALAQSAVISFLVFSILGIGMAAPYMILASFPALLRFVPKPGAWMETFKQLMGFPMLAVVIWLAFVLTSQLGQAIQTILMVSMLILGFACWVYGKWNQPICSTGIRWTARLVAFGLVAVVCVMGMKAIDILRPDGGSAMTETIVQSHGIDWQPFNRQQIDTLRAEGKPVFIDFTADWCLSCKFNEKVAFTREVADAFKQSGIVTMKADWTNRNEEITRALEEHGRTGVPLYIFYPADPAQSPEILPQVLSPSIMLKAISRYSLHDLQTADNP